MERPALYYTSIHMRGQITRLFLLPIQLFSTLGRKMFIDVVLLLRSISTDQAVLFTRAVDQVIGFDLWIPSLRRSLFVT